MIGIQKVSLQPIGFEDFCGESFQVRGKKAEVWVKVSFCCRSAQQCWESWESVLNSMMFSKKLKVGQAECGGGSMAEGLGRNCSAGTDFVWTLSSAEKKTRKKQNSIRNSSRLSGREKRYEKKLSPGSIFPVRYYQQTKKL